ncbi:MAG: hypothetical protein B6U76_03030 [Desulfurococcales archaeon ex4484_217_2]|nr:MAG: hypothetical protein B6U76_03030 [Desulfurococcales archaeon ex4484_217_2]
MEKKIKVQTSRGSLDLKLVESSRNLYLVEDEKLGTMKVKVVNIDDNKVELLVNEKKYNVFLDRSSKIIYVNGTPLRLLITKAGKFLAKFSHAATSTKSRNLSEGKPVVTPISGRIVSLKVKENDYVRKDDVIVIIESMKMLNEIRAPFEGVVLRVNVAEGDMVKKGQELLVLK